MSVETSTGSNYAGHPILTRLGSLRRRARLLFVGHALAWLVGTAAVIALAWGLLDYAVHIDDRGLRWLAYLSGLGGIAFLVLRRLLPAWLARLDDLYLAQRVERRFPQLGDGLASSVQFLADEAGEQHAGSRELRQRVIGQVTLDLESLPLRETIDPRPTRRAGGLALLALLIAVGFFAADPVSARLALDRLLRPWSDTSWPKQNQWALRQHVPRVPLHKPLEIEAFDAAGGSAQVAVTIHYRYPGPSAMSEKRETMLRVGDVFVARIDKVDRPFFYRVTGGDDDSMPWHEVDVVEPPAISELKIWLDPPAYTGWASRSSEPGIRALIGTKIRLAGKSTKPLREAAIHVESGERFPLKITDEGFGFEQSADAEPAWIVARSTTYRIELIDEEQFAGATDGRYDLRAIDDQPPSVAIEEPAADVFVTADAVVPLRVLAKDDLAIARVVLLQSRSDQSDQPAAELPLFEGPAVVVPIDGEAMPSGESRVLNHSLELAPWGLQPGTTITLQASASDYRPLSSESHARRLTIITPAELQDRLAERQSFVLGELSRVLKLQKDARGQLSDVATQWDQVERLTKGDVDRLQQAELLQRQVERGLTSKADGLPAHVSSLLADLKNNKLGGTETEHRMRSLIESLATLAAEQLPAAGRELNAALKGAQSRLQEAAAADAPATQARPDGATRQSLDQAGEKQDEIIAALEQSLGELTQWDNYRQFHRELSHLRREQEQVRRDSQAIGQRTVTREWKDLAAQDQADLKKLANRQLELAREFDKIQQRMGESADAAEGRDPVTADTLRDAVHQARDKALGGTLRDAGKGLEQNQVSQAAQQQERALQELDQLLDVLANRRENELGRLVKKLREAEAELDTIRREQEGLRKKLRDNAAQPDEMERRRELERLTRQQRELQEKLERFSRQLHRLQADRAARTASRGAQKMEQAGQQGQQGQAGQAAEQADQASRDLDDVARQLAEQRRQAEADLANEQMARLEQLVQGLIGQQDKLLAETRHYDGQQRAAGRLSRAESLSVQDLGRAQGNLAEETTGLGNSLTTDVFRLAFTESARAMSSAARRLADRDVGPATLDEQLAAVHRLRLVLDALSPDPPEPNEGEKNEQQGGNSGGQSGGNQPKQPNLAELKLLKLMQQALNERTRTLEQRAADQGMLTEDLRREFEDLSREQGSLADLLLKLTTPPPAAVEPASEDLNDLLQPSSGAKGKGTVPPPERGASQP